MKFLSSLSKKDLENKTCLLRVDLNVQDEDLKDVIDLIDKAPLRFKAILPTIKFLSNNGAKVVILSHRGRPKKVCKECSLKFASAYFSKALDKEVKFINNFDFGNIKNEINNSVPRSIFLLENLRFLPEEEKNDLNFAKQLASLGDLYINDAFGVSHRANASVSAITKFLPSCAGFVLEAEINNLNKLRKPKKPFIVILGGAKISDKLGLINKFIKSADKFLTGGGIANTFLFAQNLPIGESLYEEKTAPVAKLLLKSKKIILPSDVVVENGKILDIGNSAIEKYSKIIKNSKTIVWNGPVGLIEEEKFSRGTVALARAIIKSKVEAVIGGGETTALFSSKFDGKLPDRIFLSTGGGAMLEYLAGKKLPGLVALEKSKNKYEKNKK